jgi:hypothetical protein
MGIHIDAATAEERAGNEKSTSSQPFGSGMVMVATGRAGCLLAAIHRWDG